MLSKLISIFLVISIISIGMANSLYAHSGNTDQNGCHNDNVNGGYHCHNPSSDSSGSDSSGIITGVIVAVVAVAIIWAFNKNWDSPSKALMKTEYMDKLPIHVELSSKFENDGINGVVQLAHHF
ncbi:MAG: YHYH domain-containing protein [Nitrospirota bacterium]